MPTKTAKRKTKVVKKSKEKEIINKPFDEKDYIKIFGAKNILRLDEIVVSTTELQGMRRALFEAQDNLDFLNSVKEHGVLQPITVVESGTNKYEIVAGENRFNASVAAEHSTIPAIIRDLSEKQIEEIQITENLQRKDLHPILQAQIFAFVMKKHELDITGVAARLGKTPGFVAKRLKLNDLSGEIKKHSHIIPIGHLEEIAKYPKEQHEKIFDLAKRGYSSADGVVSLNTLKKRIDQNILLDLKFAPFDTSDDKLLKNVPACLECPKRTSSEPYLYEQLNAENEKVDKCLDRDCFANKKVAYFKQSVKTVKSDNKLKKMSDVPLISDSHYIGYGKQIDGFEENKYYDQHFYKLISKKKDDCEKVTQAVFIDSENFGEIVEVCLKNSKCEKHFPEDKKESSKSSDEDIRRRQMRSERLLDIKSMEPLRQSVITQAKHLAGNLKYIFSDKFLMVRLIGKLLDESDNLDLVEEFCQFEGDKNKAIQKGYSYYENGRDEAIEVLTEQEQAHLIYCLLMVDYCQMPDVKETYAKIERQEPIKELAAEIGMNYDLIEARSKYDALPKKHKKQFKEEYLDKIEAGKKAKMPRFYVPEWDKEKMV